MGRHKNIYFFMNSNTRIANNTYNKQHFSSHKTLQESSISYTVSTSATASKNATYVHNDHYPSVRSHTVPTRLLVIRSMLIMQHIRHLKYGCPSPSQASERRGLNYISRSVQNFLAFGLCHVPLSHILFS